MKTFNGSRLKSARQYRGLTVEELSEKVNVSKQTISQYENGKISDVPFDRMLSLSKELNFPYEYFLQKNTDTVLTGSTYFRSLMKTGKKYRLSQIKKMEHLAIIYSYLREYVNFPALNLPPWIGEVEDPSEAAKMLRDFWKLGKKPLNDIMRLAEENGIVVTMFRTETDDIDAFSQFVEFDGQEVYLVALSANKTSAVRLNFDIAHELGHIMLHEWSEDEEIISREQFKEKEREANAFAAEFLLPEDEFTKDISLDPINLNYYIHLKNKWNVSIASMVYRSCELGIITHNQYQHLMRSMQIKNWRKEEPLDNIMASSQPSLLSDAVELLLSNNIFSPEEFVNEISDMGLAMNSDELEILLNLPVGTLEKKGNDSKKLVDLKDLKR